MREDSASSEAGSADVILDLSGRERPQTVAGASDPETWSLRGVPVEAGAFGAGLSHGIAELVRDAQVTPFELVASVPGHTGPRVLQARRVPAAPDFAGPYRRVPGGVRPAARSGEARGRGRRQPRCGRGKPR